MSRSPRNPISVLVHGAIAAFGASNVRAQCPSFGPVTADVHASQMSAYDQIWCDVSRGPNGVAVAWSSGQDVFARFFDTELTPTSGDLWVNSNLYLDVQDEPAIAWSTGGHALVAWSERHGYDGEQMGIFGRVFAGDGTAVGSEFQINVDGAASQWRPLIAPRVGGGYLVAWSGDWDGDSFFRILDDDGTPLSGDLRVNTWEYDAQVDPAIAEAPDGTIFVVFVDFSGHGGIGDGLNLWARTFDADGTPRQTEEFPLLSHWASGDQREPRVAVDGLGRFVVVYQDTLADGSGNAVMCRRFATDATPLGAEFLVNTTTFSDQLEARVVATTDGSFAVTWMDYSQGQARVVGQRFDSSANQVGGEFVVDENSTNVSHHNLTSSPDGTELVAGYDADGDGTDVYVLRFAAANAPYTYGVGKLNSRGCLPSAGSIGSPSATSSSPFWITAGDVLNNKFGFMVYGFGPSFTPFQGGTLLVAQPFRRLGAQNSGGNPPPNDCSGTLAFDFNVRIQNGLDPLLAPGTTVCAQWIYRDSQDPAGFGTGLTNALRFTICP